MKNAENAEHQKTKNPREERPNAKTKETGTFPEVTPVEPEFTTYRFKNSMVNNTKDKL